MILQRLNKKLFLRKKIGYSVKYIWVNNFRPPNLYTNCYVGELTIQERVVV